MLFVRSLAARFHAIYQNTELVVGLMPLRVIQGDAPQRVQGMVLEWAADHQRELLEAWNGLSAARQPKTITPLV